MSLSIDTSLIDRYEMSPEARALAIEVLEKLDAKFKNDGFVFDPEPHEYFINGKPLVSATTLIKRFTHEFDKDYQLPISAAKAGKTVEELEKEWDYTRDRACDLGSWTHDKIEDTYRGKLNEDAQHEDPEVNERFEKFLEVRNTRLSNLIPLALEYRMFIEKWGLSGTMDALFMLGSSLQMFVGDWKTNGKFTTEDDYAFEMLREPFNRFKQCKLTEYSIQVSLYRIFLEEAGIKTDGAFLCHIPPKGPAIVHKARDFRPQLRKYLDENCLEKTDKAPELANNSSSPVEPKNEWWFDPAIIFGY